jgi:hypothetical protein
MLRPVLAVSALLAGSAVALLPILAAEFADYPAAQQHNSSEVVLPDFRGRDAWARRYRTRITNAAKAGPNFAGHYALVQIGCGTSCRFAFLVDVTTGQVHEFPLGGEDNYQLELSYQEGSRLVRAQWKAEGSEGTCIRRALLWNGSAFEIQDEQPVEAIGGFCPPLS